MNETSEAIKNTILTAPVIASHAIDKKTTTTDHQDQEPLVSKSKLGENKQKQTKNAKVEILSVRLDLSVDDRYVKK